MNKPLDKLRLALFRLDAAARRWLYSRKFARYRKSIGLPLRQSKTMRV